GRSLHDPTQGHVNGLPVWLLDVAPQRQGSGDGAEPRGVRRPWRAEPTLYEGEPCLALAVLQLPGRDTAVAEVHRHFAAGLESDDPGRVPDLVEQRFVEPAHGKASADPRLDPDRKAGPRTDLIGVDERLVDALARRVDLQFGPQIGAREVTAVPDAPSFQE